METTAKKYKDIPVGVSARHIHLSQPDLETLFGEGYQLTVKKELAQPGQYAAHERVDIVTEKATFKGVGILGPVRPKSQVEISLSDALKLGLQVPVRDSGDIKKHSRYHSGGSQGHPSFIGRGNCGLPPHSYDPGRCCPLWRSKQRHC